MAKIEMKRSGQDITATVPATMLEDHDDCLAAAIEMVGEEDPGFSTETAEARWETEDREAVIVKGWTASDAPARVMDYETGDALEGEPSEELVRASANEHSGTGAVAAYCDEHGIWRHVADADVSLYESRGETVRTVYIEA